MENEIVESGYKCHMNDVNSTIGLYNLPHVDELLEKERTNARYYDEHLQGIQGLTLLKHVGNPSYWLYTIRVERKIDLWNI